MKYHLEGLVLKLSDPFEGPIILSHNHMRVASIYLSNVTCRRQETGQKTKRGRGWLKGLSKTQHTRTVGIYTTCFCYFCLLCKYIVNKKVLVSKHPNDQGKKRGKTWVWPPPCNSDHQDYYIFSRNPYKPSFTTVTVRGPYPTQNLLRSRQNKKDQKKLCFHFLLLMPPNFATLFIPKKNDPESAFI